MSTTIKLTHPTVHMNGTSRHSLREGYLLALHAVRAAETALGCCYPNGRDYHPQGPAAIDAAMAEHRTRAAKVREVIDELSALAEGLL